MALPKLMYPTFDLIIPSTKETVKFRPFLVREEKLLLMAKQGEEKNDIINVLKQVISNCDVDGKLDVNSLASFDLEYVFLKLRGKSINNIIELSYTDLEDEKVYNFSIDVDDIQILQNDEHSKLIELSDTSGIVMKYPDAALMSDVVNKIEMSDILFVMIRGCMEKYYDGDTITYFKDCTVQEVDEFIENLPTDVLRKFEKFFDTMPRLYHKLEYTNSNGTERTIELRTLEDFFTLG
jgi:hypothetical protein